MSPRYAAQYCEENIWHLCRDVDAPREVVFVSNPGRSVLMFGQRAGREPDGALVWDYHVVLFVLGAVGWRVRDLDFRLGDDQPAPRWIDLSFPIPSLPEELAPRFRVVDGPRFLERFASDRRHMRGPDGGWLAPPPPWPPIGEGHALPDFIDVEAPGEGTLLDLPALRARYRVAG